MTNPNSIRYTQSSLCQLREINLSCFGCCGYIKGSKAEVYKVLNKNTKEFSNSHNMKDFIWRNPPMSLTSCGLCPNLVLDDVRKDFVFCPGHPERNNGVDYRDGYCDTLHLCKSAFLYDLWDDSRKLKFRMFLKGKKSRGELDTYSYSIGIDSGSLVAEFEGFLEEGQIR